MITSNPMHNWFMYLFDEKKDKDGFVKCFECGKRMHEDTWKELTTCYSHLLSKKTFPQYKGCEDNIAIVHPDCHFLYTFNPKAAINQFEKYNILLEKHYNKEII